MMWDFSGGRRSPQPPAPPVRMPTPSFPVPSSNILSAPYAQTPNLGSSYPPLPLYGSSVPPPPQSAHPGYFDVQQTPRDVRFPSVNQYTTTAGQTIVIHHSKHHSKSSHRRQRHHSHTHATVPIPISSAPQLPIYTSGPYPKPAIVFPPVIHQSSHSNLHQQHPAHVQNHVSFTKPPKTLSKPSASNSKPEPEFQYYSKCSGNRKALCIGINYRGQSNELRGCVNDAKRVRDFLIRRGGYRPENIVLLTDDAVDPRQLPTRANIIACMKWLVRHAQPHDALFFHYSGHGGQTRDLDGDEVDGWDEVIFPLDFKKHGHITDDEMHDLMVRPLPERCRLTALFDACHSGTVLDLPYIYSSHGRLKGSHVSDRARRSKSTHADVISWSGCKDGQTSADTFHEGVAVGAMSHAFVDALRNQPSQSYQELLRAVRLILQPRFSQKPQLGSSHHINTNLKFVF